MKSLLTLIARSQISFVVGEVLRTIMKRKLILSAIATSTVSASAVSSANAQDLVHQIKNSLNTEEQALWDKNLTMETFSPNEHSSISIDRIDATYDSKTGRKRKVENPEPVLCLVFGMEDAAPAREEGKSMAESRYSSAQAEQFLFAEGWDKYHDRFLTRAYVQEGLEAYDIARRGTK
jgi:hypothetical protein